MKGVPFRLYIVLKMLPISTKLYNISTVQWGFCSTFKQPLIYLPNEDTMILKYLRASFTLESSEVGTYYTAHLRSGYYYANLTNREVKNQELVSERTSDCQKPQWVSGRIRNTAKTLSQSLTVTKQHRLSSWGKKFGNFYFKLTIYSHIQPINLNKRN